MHLGQRDAGAIDAGQGRPDGCQVGLPFPVEQRVVCVLADDDYRFEGSGSADWTEEEVRRIYRDWKLAPADRPRPSEGNGAR